MSFSLFGLKLQLRGSHCHPGAAPGCQGWRVLSAGAVSTSSPITGVLGEAVSHKVVPDIFRQRQHQGSLNSKGFQRAEIFSSGLWPAESSWSDPATGGTRASTLHCLVWGGISRPMKTSLPQTPVWHLKMLYPYFSITYVGIQALSHANYRVLNYGETILQCCCAIIQKTPVNLLSW